MLDSILLTVLFNLNKVKHFLKRFHYIAINLFRKIFCHSQESYCVTLF